ncbi:MAG TPA: hypothetical protein VIL86_12540 [Tepidisphaeraceae bacterium]
MMKTVILVLAASQLGFVVAGCASCAGNEDDTIHLQEDIRVDPPEHRPAATIPSTIPALFNRPGVENFLSAVIAFYEEFQKWPENKQGVTEFARTHNLPSDFGDVKECHRLEDGRLKIIASGKIDANKFEEELIVEMPPPSRPRLEQPPTR